MICWEKIMEDKIKSLKETYSFEGVLSPSSLPSRHEKSQLA